MAKAAEHLLQNHEEQSGSQHFCKKLDISGYEWWAQTRGLLKPTGFQPT